MAGPAAGQPGPGTSRAAAYASAAAAQDPGQRLEPPRGREVDLGPVAGAEALVEPVELALEATRVAAPVGMVREHSRASLAAPLPVQQWVTRSAVALGHQPSDGS